MFQLPTGAAFLIIYTYQGKHVQDSIMMMYRSTLHKDGSQSGGHFVIMVFVNDVEQDVMEGTDGVPHV